MHKGFARHVIQAALKNTTYKSYVFSLQSPIFLHTLPPNSAALPSVSWINSLRQHGFTSTDATSEKRKEGMEPNGCHTPAWRNLTNVHPKKKGKNERLLLVIKTEYKICAKLGL